MGAGDHVKGAECKQIHQILQLLTVLSVECPCHVNTGENTNKERASLLGIEEARDRAGHAVQGGVRVRRGGLLRFYLLPLPGRKRLCAQDPARTRLRVSCAAYTLRASSSAQGNPVFGRHASTSSCEGLRTSADCGLPCGRETTADKLGSKENTTGIGVTPGGGCTADLAEFRCLRVVTERGRVRCDKACDPGVDGKS
eukprot:gene24757-biopygen7422